MQMTDWLVDWFERNTAATREELVADLDANYFDKGWLDSFQLINFLPDLENHARLQFNDVDFQDRDFMSINGLVRIIGRKQTDAV